MNDNRPDISPAGNGVQASAPMRMVWRIGAGIAVGIAVLLILAVGIWMRMNLYTPLHLAKPETVIIGRGASMRYVADRLEARRLIPNAFAFRAYARATNRANQLKIGEYDVTDGMRPVDILDLLVSGRARAYSLTIPEGKWASEIDDLVATHWPQAAKQMPGLMKDPGHWRDHVSFPLSADSLEGYLFPDTYRFDAGADAEQIVGKMLERFQITCAAAYEKDPPVDGRSLRDVLILASLVEAEAKIDRERPIIAGVYMNRLRDNTRTWTLDCDATLIYAQQTRLTRVLNRDKLVDSPYNTYKFHGLPPGPINNPGLASFKAALHPAKVPYFFYVARGDGSHVFTRTLDEHNAVIRRLRGK